MYVWFVGGQTDGEDKVSLELTEEIIQSMEVGMAFRDYVNFSLCLFSESFSIFPAEFPCLFNSFIFILIIFLIME